MKLRQRTLAKLSRGYSIAALPAGVIGEIPAFLAGSEGDGELLFFEPPRFQPRIIARAPGGFISLATLAKGGRRFAVASTMFKPGFDAAGSEIRLYPLDEGEWPVATLIARLPFTHRVAMLRHGGRDLLLASTLCAAKTHKEDWDGDGEPEIFSISPFHGHVLSLHKKTPAGWKRTVIHDDLGDGPHRVGRQLPWPSRAARRQSP